MLVNIEGVAQPADANGIREIVPYVYTSADSRETPSEVRDANHAREIVRRLCIPESVFVDAEPPRGEGYDPMWIVQVSVLNTRNKITTYRTGYHKYDGCPLAAIGYMMDIYAAIRKILKNSRKELEKERNEKREKKLCVTRRA